MKVKEINGKINGLLSLEQIAIERIRTVEVSANNKTSGRVLFPLGEIGQTVYILYPKKEASKHD